MTSPSKRARCGYTLRQSRLADIGRIHLGARLLARLRPVRGQAVSISPKEACVGTMDGACTWREGERVNEASSRSLKRSGKRLSRIGDCSWKRHGGTRSRSSSAHASQGRWSCGLRSLGSELGFYVRGLERGDGPLEIQVRESVKMVHRAYPGTTIES